MKKCQKCNFENEDNAAFCSNCGKKLEIQTKDNKVLAWLGLITLILGFLGIFLLMSNKKNIDNDAIYLQLEADQPLTVDKDLYFGNIHKYGSRINFTIKTNAEWAVQENFSIEISRIAFYNYKDKIFYSQGTFSITEEREQHCIPPICTINFIDDRHFSITVDANEGTDRYISFWLKLKNQGEKIESCFINYKQQGEWTNY